MPKNYLSYSGVIATLSTLVLAACTSAPTPEEAKLAQVQEENRRIYGEDYSEEIDLHELARQVVFLEQERQELLFENAVLRGVTRDRNNRARQYRLLPVDIAYYRTFAVEEDVIHITSLNRPELPTFSFCTRGPASWDDFDRNNFYYEELPIYLPGGEYKVEVFNAGVLRFTSRQPVLISSPPIRTTIVGPEGEAVTIAPPNNTIFMMAKGYKIE